MVIRSRFKVAERKDVLKSWRCNDCFVFVSIYSLSLQAMGDVGAFLNLERRTGIKKDDINDFLTKVDAVDEAIRGLKVGQPSCNHGIKGPIEGGRTAIR